MKLARTKGKRIIKYGDEWRVPSQSNDKRHYIVKYDGRWTCTCDDFADWGIVVDCKHILAVDIVRKHIDVDAGTELGPLKPKYVTNEKVAEEAEENVPRLFPKLVRDLCAIAPVRTRNGKVGRLPRARSDLLYAAIMKVYHDHSWPRTKGELRRYQREGLVHHVPGRTTIARHLADPTLTPILQRLVSISAAPLSHLEEGELAVDSSGVSLRTYGLGWRRLRPKADKTNKGEVNVNPEPLRKMHGWLKLHIAAGPRTNCIAAAIVKHGHTGDAPMLPELLKAAKTAGFGIGWVYGDGAYSSHDNVEVIFGMGGFPMIPFSEGTGEGVGAPESWRLLYKVYQAHRIAFEWRYGKRQNAESTFSSFKRTVGASVRSRTYHGQVNEVLVMALTHNVRRVIHFMYLLGVTPAYESMLLAEDAAKEQTLQ